MRKYLYIILSCFIAIALLSGTDMEAKKVRKSKKDKTEVKDTVAKKTPYQKFVEKKGLQKEEGFMTIYKDDSKVYLEIPDSVFGRRVVFSSRLEKASEALSAGTELSSRAVYVIEKTDSLVLFRKPATNIVVKDKGIADALGERCPIVHAFPIKYRNSDSSAVVIESGKLFDMSDSKVVRLAGKSGGEGLVITAASYKSDLSIGKNIVSFGNSVGIYKEATYELTLAVSGFGFVVAENPMMSLDVLLTLTLLPEETMAVRETDQRIGTRMVPYTSFDVDGGTEKGYWVTRWNLQPKDMKAYLNGEGSEVVDPIRIYVDTLLGPTWTKAVTDGIMAWEPAFEAIGLRNAIIVEPYSSDSAFVAASPLTSCISYVGGTGTSIGASVLTDTSTGQILSCRMTVPGDYIAGVHRLAVYSIADVDSRYQTYFLSDDAVCEVLKAQVMRNFGLCLGLTGNYAGSHAYSPEQLRDPEFTAQYGITASVTDDVLFNYLAMPGDKEKGVKIVVDKIGAYDELAINWLYGIYPDDEETALDSLLDSVQGKPEYFYSAQSRRMIDPRALTNDLGNDAIAAYKAGLSHLKYVVDNGDKWIEDERISEEYRTLFLDWIFLRYFRLSYMMSAQVGGMMTNELGSGLPKISTVPEARQKEIVKLSLNDWMNTEWMDKNKRLFRLSGIVKNVSDFSRMNAVQSSGILLKFPYVIMAANEAGSTYSPEEFLSDVQEIILKNARKGKIKSFGEDFAISQYLAMLMGYSSVMTQNYNDAQDKKDCPTCLQDNYLRAEITGVPVKYAQDMEELSYASMKKAREIIMTGIVSSRDSYTRNRLYYFLSIVDDALGNRNCNLTN